MKKIQRIDILDLSEYEKVREEYRQRIIEMKKHRRADIPPNFSFLFENRESVIFQVQEMMRIENVRDENEIQTLIQTYNPMIPEDDEISVTMYILFEDEDQMRRDLQTLQGIGRGVYLKVEDAIIQGVPEEGRESGPLISTVQYLRFKFAPREVQLLKSGQHSVSLKVNHPHYSGEVILSEEARRSLAEDL